MALARTHERHLEATLDRLDLVIVDELGFVSRGPAEAQLLFTLFTRRCVRRALIVTSNSGSPAWTGVFAGDDRPTARLLDRLSHLCRSLEFCGSSYRFRRRLAVGEGLLA